MRSMEAKKGPGGAAAHQQLVFEGRGVQLQILSPGVTEAVWQWLRREAGGSERVGHIDSQGETFFFLNPEESESLPFCHTLMHTSQD